ncbi:MAG TPA: methionine biosynthesis protein MetW, partial [Spirochaetia bacterium]|nr:methionine biosynthesis protein MetW [Spirochaetia bacterium]
QQVLLWAVRKPHAVRGVVAIATAPRLTSQSLAFDIVGRNAIMRDPNYRGGQYYGRTSGPDVGLAIARMIGHITYLSRESMQEKFEANRDRPREVTTGFEKRFSVGSYLGYQGDRFVERFDANSYIFLSLAMDLFDLGDTPEELAARLKNTDCRWLVLSFSSDWLFPPDQSREIVNALVTSNREVSCCNVTSSHGHDSFLLEHELPVYGELIRGFLENLGVRGGMSGTLSEDETRSICLTARNGESGPSEDPASIYGAQRLDYDHILELIPSEASVLDLGCGHGGLLCLLKRRGYRRLMGVELNEQAIISCVQKGLNVIHADLNEHLRQFTDEQFDCVVLSQTLQVIRDIDGLLTEMVRVGKTSIVSFPNFAYHKLRRMLSEQGRAPETHGLLRYKWFDTPNIRFFSIADFEDLCRGKGIRIHQKVALDTEERREVSDDPNLNADLAIFVISR